MKLCLVSYDALCCGCGATGLPAGQLHRLLSVDPGKRNERAKRISRLKAADQRRNNDLHLNMVTLMRIVV